MKQITIGQYYPTDSVLHRLDPRVKMVGTLIYIISLFFVRNWGYIIGGAFLVAMILLSKVPFRFILRGMKGVLILILITVILNLFLTPGDVIWQWKILKITRQGVEMALTMALRMSMLILGATLMTLTTTPNKLTDALESLLRPLKKIRVPVHEFAMMISIALRFIPILSEETDKISKAQKARGADFEDGGMIKKVKAMIPLLVPLFVSAFRRANDLAMAMEARCYHGGENRTQMKPLRYADRDKGAYAVLMIYLIAIFIAGFILHI